MKVIPDSSTCCKSELDLFYSPPTNTSILSSAYSEAHPNTPLKGTEENFDINIPGSNEYIDLNDIYLCVEVDLFKNETQLTATTAIAPINNLGHSLFQRIDLSIGHNSAFTVVEVGNSNYAYKAYMLNLLNFGIEAKTSWLQSGLFYKDDAGKFDKITLPTSKTVKKEGLVDTTADLIISNNSDSNSGFLNRNNAFVQGKGKVRMIIPIHCDLLHSNKFLINHLGLYFKFTRSTNDFLLMGAEEWNIRILKASVFVRKCHINESIKLAHVQALQISPIKYPIKQNKVVSHNIAQNTKEYIFAGISTKIPNKIIVGLLDHDAYNGSRNKNPFNFQDFGLASITLTIDNYNKTIKIDKSNNDYIEGYHSLCECLNMYGATGNSINIRDYMGGNCLFCFNLDADKGCEEQFNPINEGSIGVTLTFGDNLATNLKMIIFMEFDNQIYINNKYETSFAITLT